MIFTFDLNGLELVFINSSWSGLERVLIDNKEVSRSRSHTKNSRHCFTVNGQEYEIKLRVESVLEGPFVCELIKEGKVISCRTIRFEPGNKYIGIASIFIGGLFGLLIVNLPEYIYFTIPTFLVCLAALNRSKRKVVFEAN